MRCPKCNESDIRVTHTYSAGSASKTHRGVCPGCGIVVTLETVVLHVDPGYGQGAAAIARKRQAPGQGRGQERVSEAF